MPDGSHSSVRRGTCPAEGGPGRSLVGDFESALVSSAEPNLSLFVVVVAAMRPTNDLEAEEWFAALNSW